MNMKKMLSLVLVSAMTLTMAATAFAEEAGSLSGANCDPANTAKTDETLTIGFGSEPSTLVGTGHVSGTAEFVIFLCNSKPV